jgi:DNA primase
MRTREPRCIVVCRALEVLRLWNVPFIEGRVGLVGRISDEDIQRVRDATDVVALISESVVLKPKGRLQWGRCPFHDEKTPSFKVDPSTQLWHCFGCGAGGDAFGFLMRQENMEFPEAVRLLADRAHVEITETGEGGPARGHKERLYAVSEAAANYFHKTLLFSRDAGATEARDYLKRRGFGIDVAKRFEIGYAIGQGALVKELLEAGFTADEIVEANLAYPSDRGDDGPRDRFFGRVMFPIREVSGRVVGFGGRVLGDGEPKYLNTQETPIFHKSRNLFAIERAKNEIIRADRTAIVVEGYTDVIALHEAGVPNVVATLGTALTRGHIRLLGRFANRVVYLFDADEAGLRAAERAAEFIDVSLDDRQGGPVVELAVALVPEGKDPADFAAAAGGEGVRAVISEAVPLLQFVLDRRFARYDTETPEGRARALKDAAGVLASVRGTLLAQDYTNYVADRLLTDYATVQKAVERARPEFSGESARKPESDAAIGLPLEGPSTPRIRAERELVGLVADHPDLRSRAQDLLASDLLSDSISRRLLAAVIEADDAVGPELFTRVSAVESRLGEVLSGLLLDTDENVDFETVAVELVRKLKEFELERQIIEQKAQMKSLDPVKNGHEYDDLFRRIATLQVEVERLRAASEDQNRPEEAWG